MNHGNYVCFLQITITLVTFSQANVKEPVRQRREAPSQQFLSSCSDIQKQGAKLNGIYFIWPARSSHSGFKKVYCDLETKCGGWTVFQKRGAFTRQQNFSRDWEDYRNGFGHLNADFWLGNEMLHHLTAAQPSRLRIELEDFEGNTRYAEYSKFKVGSANMKYVLSVSGYSGNAGDGMAYSNGYRFSTYDNDNDMKHGSCARTYWSGWWFRDCHWANLNGVYLRGKHKIYGQGIDWNPWRGHYYSLRSSRMMVRPANWHPTSDLE